MQADAVIKVQNVSKAYTMWSSPSARLHGPMIGRIGRLPFLPTRLRENCQRLSHQSFRNFYALRNVSFEVRRGECLGIVGMNGSGKSTLLQVIAGILEPTAGSVEVRGKVAALLELGSGFNPEFTGRENVFMNGSVLGLRREEIATKFDEIAAFADIGDFMEQPTKTYSSGMVLRLAFAVQAVLNLDILIVDEALAVGDEAFQRKCFSRIQSFRENGGTTLFVSHAASAVVELCERAILLDRGELLLSGAPKQVVARYLKLLYAPPDRRDAIRREISETTVAVEQSVIHTTATTQSGLVTTTDESYDPGMVPKSTVSYASRGAEIVSPHIETTCGKRVNVLVRGREYVYKYAVRFAEPAFKVRFGMLIKTVSGFELGGAVSHSMRDGLASVEAGRMIEVVFKFRCLLQTGVYFLNSGVLGLRQDTEVYLARHVDIAMFRVRPETDILVTGIVDFCAAVQVSFVQEALPSLMTNRFSTHIV